MVTETDTAGKEEYNNDYLSFKLPDDFVDSYKDKTVQFGFPIGGGNTLGEIVFYQNYSRLKEDGSKERWHEVCRRVIEGMFSVLKDHVEHNRAYWNHQKALASAKEAYERMFEMKWTPPGRGLFAMGTPFVNGANGSSASLQNCSYLSTINISNRSVKEATLPFRRMMEMSMNGVGVGFDVRGAGKLKLHQPNENETFTFIVPDTREGWAESLAVQLESFFFENRPKIIFDYSKVRPAGAPLKTFGGTASGFGPLKSMHESINSLLSARSEQLLSSEDIVDIMNLAGKAVIAGSTRRSAQISFGEIDDKEFISLKDYDIYPDRNGADGWSYLSNNSVFADVGDNLDHIIDKIAINGEPGIFYLNTSRQYGRMIDPPDNKDHRVMGTNPCGEQPLEHGECCTLCECYPSRHESLEDFKRTLKYAYLYGKAVTLLPTPWPESNEVMQRNRRIGLSLSGLVEFVESKNWTELRTWMNEGYKEVQHWDRSYSEWLGVRESIKTTSVKPSGSVSLVAGVTPGVHWPTNSSYIRRIRLREGSTLVSVLQKAGYHVEPDYMDPESTVVVELPTLGRDTRTEKDVTIWEKTSLAVLAQRYWADNQVSFTCTFLESEKEQIAALLRSFEGQLKGLSFLPILDGGAYEQMPYEELSLDSVEEKQKDIKPLDWAALYAGNMAEEAIGEKYCTTSVCEMKFGG